jgi:hypothetical protein
MKILLRWNYKMKRTDKRLRIEDRGQTKDEINNVELRLGGKSVDSLVCLLSSLQPTSLRLLPSMFIIWKSLKLK